MRIPYRYVGVLVALVGISACSGGGGTSSVPGTGPAGSQPASQSRGVLSVGGPTCNVPGDYPTIQAAVSVPACTTVNVAAGIYTENVTIAHALTLKGARAGVDARSRSGSESVINGGAGPNITVASNNVTVDGFTLNGPPTGATAAIVMMGANTGETIKNNIINNPGRAASYNTSSTIFQRNLVIGGAATVSGFQANTTPVQNVTVADNTFRGANPVTTDADINFIEGKSNIIVTGNKTTGDGTLVALFKTNGAVVFGNTVIGDPNSSAIYIGGADSNIAVFGNTVTGAGSGVNVANDFGLGPSTGVTITANVLRNNGNGVKVGPTAAAVANTVVAHRNALTGNSGFGVNNLSPVQVDATCNWWGARNGPGPVGPGSGDKVTTNVTYSPWLTSSDLDSRCNGTPNGGGGGDHDDGHGGHDGDNDRHDRD